MFVEYCSNGDLKNWLRAYGSRYTPDTDIKKSMAYDFKKRLSANRATTGAAQRPESETSDKNNIQTQAMFPIVLMFLLFVFFARTFLGRRVVDVVVVGAHIVVWLPNSQRNGVFGS